MTGGALLFIKTCIFGSNFCFDSGRLSLTLLAFPRFWPARFALRIDETLKSDDWYEVIGL